jgi:hypothetical protein
MASTAETGQSTGEQAKEKAQEVAGQAQEKAQQAAGQARVQVRDQLDQRSTQAGERISTQASDIRSVGQQLREQGKDGPARVADQAAERIEKVGDYLRQSDADRILDDVEHYARSNPWAVMVGGLALGFVASRFLKASSSERYQTRGYTMQQQRSRSQLPAGYAGDRRFSRDLTGAGTGVSTAADPLGTGTGLGTGTAGTGYGTDVGTGTAGGEFGAPIEPGGVAPGTIPPTGRP